VSVSGQIEILETTRSFHFEGDDQAVLRRFICCALIATMPDEGMDECLLEIRNMHHFYSVIPEPVLPKSGNEEVVAKLPVEA
jgi:hypothetical protein